MTDKILLRKRSGSNICYETYDVGSYIVKVRQFPGDNEKSVTIVPKNPSMPSGGIQAGIGYVEFPKAPMFEENIDECLKALQTLKEILSDPEFRK